MAPTVKICKVLFPLLKRNHDKIIILEGRGGVGFFPRAISLVFLLSKRKFGGWRTGAEGGGVEERFLEQFRKG